MAAGPRRQERSEAASRGQGDRSGPNTEDRLVCIGNLSMNVLLTGLLPLFHPSQLMRLTRDSYRIQAARRVGVCIQRPGGQDRTQHKRQAGVQWYP